jgi:BCD family chlorophyll transporter-like MFS transporter
MGLWGAAQALAFALGGLTGTLAVDIARWAFGSPTPAYTSVFLGEAALFIISAVLARIVARGENEDRTQEQFEPRMEHAR